MQLPQDQSSRSPEPGQVGYIMSKLAHPSSCTCVHVHPSGRLPSMSPARSKEPMGRRRREHTHTPKPKQKPPKKKGRHSGEADKMSSVRDGKLMIASGSTRAPWPRQPPYREGSSDPESLSSSLMPCPVAVAKRNPQTRLSRGSLPPTPGPGRSSGVRTSWLTITFGPASLPRPHVETNLNWRE